MLRLTWANLMARKLRLLLSAFAVVLGVAFVSGSLIFTDALGSSFDDIIEGTVADVEIAPPGALDFDSAQDNRTIDAAVLDDLAALPGVARASGFVQQLSVFVIGENGKAVGGMGPPGLGFNYTETTAVTGKPILTFIEGAPPVGDAEVALDRLTAEKGGYSVGETVTVITPGKPSVLKAELSGIVEFGAGSTNGATITIMDTAFMQERFFGGRDVYSSVSLEAKPGVSQDELQAAAAEILPKNLEARTGAEVVQTNKDGLEGILGGIRTFMLVFAAISLIVGAFLIINTFSILIAQRGRELALLRALGAGRRQIIGSVLGEAFAIGLIGATLGLGMGVVLAQGIRALLSTFGLDLSGASFAVTPGTVVWSYLLGILVTMVAGLLPALRASRIPAVAAMRDDVSVGGQGMTKRVVIGVVMVLVGALSTGFGFVVDDGSTGLSLVGFGLFLVLVGVSLTAPLLARPVVAVIGSVYRRLVPSVGGLAAANAGRNPRRTAATASALMIGVALMSAVGIFGASASATSDASVETSLKADLVLSNAVGTTFSTDIAEQVRALDGVAEVAQIKQAFPEIDGSMAYVAGVEAGAFVNAIEVEASGSLSDLDGSGVAVNRTTANSQGLALGDSLTMSFQGADVDLQVVAIFENEAAVPAEYLVAEETLSEGGLAPLDSQLLITLDPTADLAQVQRALEELTAEIPTLTVKDPAGYAEEQKAQVNTFLNLIYSLLALSIVIAALGVVNTLGLSVIERTREIGLLRAVGLTRWQLNITIWLESVVIAVLGALLGVVVGTGIGIALVKALADQGLSELAIPIPTLATFVMAAALLGLLAAVIPGIRAARLNVLNAIATD